MPLDRFDKRARVFEGDVDVQMGEIRAPLSLDDAQHLGMRQPRRLQQPALVIQSHRVEHERVLVPVTDRVPHPGRVRIRGMRAAVEERLPIVRVLLEQVHEH